MADEIPTEALQAAARAYSGATIGPYAGDHDEGILAALSAAAPYLIAEGRRQAAAEIRAGTGPGKQMPNDMRHAPWWSSLSGPYPAGFAEWAARVAEGTDHG